MKANSFIKGISTSYFRIFFQMAVALFMTPYILTFLSMEEYGAYSLALSSIQFLALFNFGFSGGLGILVSRNTQNSNLVSTYSSVVQTLQLFLGIAGMLIGFYIAVNFSDYFEIQEKNEESFTIVMIIFSVSFFVTMVTQVFSTLFFSYRQIVLDNTIGIITSIVGSGLIIIFLQLDTGVIGLSFSLLITQLLTLGIYLIRMKFRLPDIHVKLFSFEKKDFKSLYEISGWIFIGSVSVFFIEKFDQLIVGKIVSIETVSVLVVTSKTFELSKKLIFTISNNFRPYFGKLLEEKRFEIAKSYFNALRQLTIALSIVVASLLILLNPYFVDAWVSTKFYGGDLVSMFLGLNLIYHSWKLPSRAFLSSHLIVKEQSIFGMVEGILNLIASIFLGYKFGLVGVIAGTFASGFISQLVFYGYILSKKGLEQIEEYLVNQSIMLGQLLVFSTVSFIIYYNIQTVEDKLVLFMILIATITSFAVIGYLLNVSQIKKLLALRSASDR